MMKLLHLALASVRLIFDVGAHDKSANFRCFRLSWNFNSRTGKNWSLFHVVQFFFCWLVKLQSTSTLVREFSVRNFKLWSYGANFLSNNSCGKHQKWVPAGEAENREHPSYLGVLSRSSKVLLVLLLLAIWLVFKLFALWLLVKLKPFVESINELFVARPAVDWDGVDVGRRRMSSSLSSLESSLSALKCLRMN